MSLSVHRKRSRRNSSDSDSDEGVPPPKLLRRKYGNRFVPLAIKENLERLSVWISDWPSTNYFIMALKKSINDLHRDATVDDDVEEEEDEVQEVIQIDPEKLRPLRERFQRKLNSENLGKPNGCTIKSRYEPLKDYPPPSNWDAVYKRFEDYSSRSRADLLSRRAPITNPRLAYEIPEETPKVAEAIATPEADEIQILSERPSTKPKHSKSLHTSKSSSVKSSMSGASASGSSSGAKKQQSSSAKDFTANEVVRLQEKAQYELLLKKYMNESKYISGKPQIMDSNVKADLDQLKFSGLKFTREILDQPIDKYIEKYHKPRHLETSDKDKQTGDKKPIEITIDDDDDDDYLKIIDEVRLPKFKPKFKVKQYHSPAWFAELKANVRAMTEERMKIAEEHEKALEKYRRQRVLKLLSIEDESDQQVEPEFPELTPEMEEAVDRALNVGPPNETLCRISSGDLLRKDIETLGGLNWLNDAVINSYFDLIVARSKQEGYPSAYAYNTFFYSTYKSKGYSGVQRWTRKLDIFSFDLNFVPIHLGVHWCLAVIDHRAKKVCYYDSMGNGEEQCLDLLHEYLRLEYKNKKGEYLDPSIYATEAMKDIPQQMNGSDCGMFTLKYAEYVSRDAEITFNQGHMQYFRRRTVYELLKGLLL